MVTRAFELQKGRKSTVKVILSGERFYVIISLLTIWSNEEISNYFRRFGI